MCFDVLNDHHIILCHLGMIVQEIETCSGLEVLNNIKLRLDYGR